jgi:hypothetical protein
MANKGLAIAGGKYKVHVLCCGRNCILVESFRLDSPAIAKPRNVISIYYGTTAENKKLH